MYNPPFPGQGTADYNTTKPCCMRPFAGGAVELIKQHALFEGGYLDCTKLSQPARHDKAVLRATSCCWCSRANQATCTIRQVA